MPSALQPMDKDIMQAILDIPADQVMGRAKIRRDELVQDSGFDPSLMEDECFDIVQASIEGAQSILAPILLNDSTISLADFAEEYKKWFVDYAKKDPLVMQSMEISDIESHPDKWEIKRCYDDELDKATEALDTNPGAVAGLIAALKNKQKLAADLLAVLKAKKTAVEAAKTAQSSPGLEELSKLIEACKDKLSDGKLDECTQQLWPEIDQGVKTLGL
jgi:hypothetical protein